MEKESDGERLIKIRSSRDLMRKNCFVEFIGNKTQKEQISGRLGKIEEKKCLNR